MTAPLPPEREAEIRRHIEQCQRFGFDLMSAEKDCVALLAEIDRLRALIGGRDDAR